MTLEQLARLARETLDQQQRYFKGGRTGTDLERAKASEARLRAACDEDMDVPKQATLFGDER